MTATVVMTRAASFKEKIAFSRSRVLSFSRSLVLSFSRCLVLSFSHSRVLAFSRSRVLAFSRSLVLSFSRSLVLSFSRSLVLSFSLSLSRCRCLVVVVSLSLSRCRCLVVVVSLSLSLSILVGSRKSRENLPFFFLRQQILFTPETFGQLPFSVGSNGVGILPQYDVFSLTCTSTQPGITSFREVSLEM